jgi:predicted ribosome quality control (RQC) complex YloA/Tae2 family protein
MKKEVIDFEDFEITYYIGQNSKENFDVIDKGFEDDLWFHSKNESSCHVVALLPTDLTLEKEEINMIIKEGATLCKMHTNKISNLKNIPIIYTEIKNITKTKEKGKVLTKNTKTIIV